MNAEENLTLMGMKLSIDKLAFEIARQREVEAVKNRYGDLPEWITLDTRNSPKGRRGESDLPAKTFFTTVLRKELPARRRAPLLAAR